MFSGCHQKQLDITNLHPNPMCKFSKKILENFSWSFGVLMFEIITLGGTPYPGVQPDDMLDLLESGVRIPQPDNCPDE